MDILLEDQRKIEQRKAAPPPVQITRADRIIAEGDARRMSYRKLNPSADTAMVYGAQVGYLHAKVRMLDAETEALNVVPDANLEYIEVGCDELGCDVTVGFSYEPGSPASITSALYFERTGDPGDPGYSEELEVQEVWANGVDIAAVLLERVSVQIATAALDKIHALQAKGREQDEPQ